MFAKRYDRGQDSAVRGGAGLYRSDDLLRTPGAEPDFLVGRIDNGFGREMTERTAHCHCGSLRVPALGEPERVCVSLSSLSSAAPRLSSVLAALIRKAKF